MPRYFFHVTDTITVVDEVGTVLHSVDEALRHANALEISIGLSTPANAEPATVEITDEAGRLIGRQPVLYNWQNVSRTKLSSSS